MRAFIAIEMSDEIRKTLAAVESHLKYADADIKWVNPDIIHLTLKFLGDITNEKVADVIFALDAVAKSVNSFEATLKDIGVFPDVRHPRVVWVGLDRGAAEAESLAGKIEESLVRLGFPKDDRQFKAHVTIGRVRSPRNADKLKVKIASASSIIQSAILKPHKVTSVILFQSTLTQQGPVYTRLHESALIG